MKSQRLLHEGVFVANKGRKKHHEKEKGKRSKNLMKDKKGDNEGVE